MFIDDQIWSLSSQGRTEEVWSAIIQHLVSALGDYLQQEVKLLEKSVIDGEALWSRIRGASTFGGVFAVGWEGRLGMEIIENKPFVSASVFLFSQGRRLSVSGQAGSYLELVYERADNGEGRWRSLGWLEDIYDEFASIDKVLG